MRELTNKEMTNINGGDFWKSLKYVVKDYIYNITGGIINYFDDRPTTIIGG